MEYPHCELLLAQRRRGAEKKISFTAKHAKAAKKIKKFHVSVPHALGDLVAFVVRISGPSNARNHRPGGYAMELPVNRSERFVRPSDPRRHLLRTVNNSHHLDPLWLDTVHEAVLPNDQFSNCRVVVFGYLAASLGEDNERSRGRN